MLAEKPAAVYTESYYRSTAPLARRPAPPTVTILIPRQPTPAQPRTRMVATFGSIGMGLWLAGWLLFGSGALGFVGLCILGILSILSAATRRHAHSDRIYVMRAGPLMWRLYGDDEYDRGRK